LHDLNKEINNHKQPSLLCS